MTSSWLAILRAAIQTIDGANTTGTVWTSAGHWSGSIRDHGTTISVWDDLTQRMTWIDPERVTAITRDPVP